MANWTITASTATETQAAQRWSNFATNEARIRTFWSNHMGERGTTGQLEIIEIDPRLTKERGDVVNTNLVLDLTEAGRTGTLETNEEQPADFADSVLIGRNRHAIRTDGKLAEQRAAFDMRAVMADRLAYWAARILLDRWIFRKLSGTTNTDQGSLTIGEAAAANSNVIFAGDATILSELEAGAFFTLDLLARAKTAAMLGQIDGSTIYKFKPYVVGGQLYYLYVDRPEVRFAMRNSDLWSDAQHQARERSADNPIFSGADGIWDGVILKFHDLVITASNAGSQSNVLYSNGLFLGAQAGSLYPAQDRLDWVEKTFDYSENYGIATGISQGMDKLRYNSIDFAVIAVRSAIETI